MGAGQQALLGIGTSAGGAPSGLSVWWLADAETEASATEFWKPATSVPNTISSGVTGAHGRVYTVTTTTGNFDLEADYGSITVRMRVRPTISATDRIIQLFDNNASSTQCTLGFVSDGSFRVLNGTSTQLDISSTGLWSINNWFFLEFKVVIGNAGSWVAKLWNDSATLLATLSGSGDIQATANSTADFVIFGSSNIDPHFDDISIDVGGNLLGICRVETLYPNAAGDLAQWTRGGTDSGANWSQVNDAVKDGADWVQSSAADQYDLYNIEPRSITGTPKAVQVNALGRRVSGGANPAQFKMVLRIGGVTYEGTKTLGYTSTAADENRFDVWNNNPATGVAWTDSDINSLQIGYKSVTGNVAIADACAKVLVQV